MTVEKEEKRQLEQFEKEFEKLIAHDVGLGKGYITAAEKNNAILLMYQSLKEGEPNALGRYTLDMNPARRDVLLKVLKQRMKELVK